ncbi:MAG: hypothetical protein FJY37_05955 [Betaproteobacteria bacterium]|nr:hypothetical protein [Betaproteobacteria bacterium]
MAIVQSAVARRMLAAVQPFAPQFVTPMAAVAGAVADEIIATMRLPGVRRCYVNNGGDIALHLTPRTHFSIGICTPEDKSWKAVALDGRVEIDHNSPVRGVAASGWRGRSFSMGIADSVTVLAINAAMADAAATMIANAVDVDSAQVKRAPANHIKDDTDLGDRLVTVEVGDLSQADIARALDAGVAAAHGMMAAGLIHAAALRLQGQSRTVGESLPAESESQRYKE